MRLLPTQTAENYSQSIQKTTQSIHLQTIDLVDAQMAEVGEQMATLDDFVTRARSQNEQHHEAFLRKFSTLGGSVRESYGSIETHIQELKERAEAFEKDMLEQTEAIKANLEPYKKAARQPLESLRKEVKSAPLKTYVPTGETPMKREYHIPGTLPKTKPHAEILSRMGDDREGSLSPSSRRGSLSPTSPIPGSPLGLGMDIGVRGNELDGSSDIRETKEVLDSSLPSSSTNTKLPLFSQTCTEGMLSAFKRQLSNNNKREHQVTDDSVLLGKSSGLSTSSTSTLPPSRTTRASSAIPTSFSSGLGFAGSNGGGNGYGGLKEVNPNTVDPLASSTGSNKAEKVHARPESGKNGNGDGSGKGSDDGQPPLKRGRVGSGGKGNVAAGRENFAVGPHVPGIGGPLGQGTKRRGA